MPLNPLDFKGKVSRRPLTWALNTNHGDTVLYDTLLARLNVLYYYEKHVSVRSADYMYVLSSLAIWPTCAIVTFLGFHFHGPHFFRNCVFFFFSLSLVFLFPTPEI